MTAERCAEVFFDILVAKYTQNEHLARVLLSTGDRYILEFDRGAGRAKRAGRTCRWGGIVEDGRVVGSNQMGALLMRVRDRLLRRMTRNEKCHTASCRNKKRATTQPHKCKVKKIK